MSPKRYIVGPLLEPYHETVTCSERLGNMSAAKVLIREASGDWAALLRRHLPDGAAIVELRQLDELWPRLREAPRAVVAMELQTDHGSAVLTELMRINHE